MMTREESIKRIKDHMKVHHSGKKMGTFWACFMKLEEIEMLEGME